MDPIKLIYEPYSSLNYQGNAVPREHIIRSSKDFFFLKRHKQIRLIAMSYTDSPPKVV